MSRSRAIGRACLRSEGGFALVEVMVSAVLLVVIALATYPVIDQSAGRTSSNRARAVAVSLAEQDQDRLRATPQDVLKDIDDTHTVTSNGVTFTIASKATLTNDVSGVITCSGSTGAAQYMTIHTAVSWPNMNGIDPVVLDSIVTPNIKGVNRGTLVVTVTKADGITGQPGIPVTVAGQTKTTDAEGCALFPSLTPGATTIAANSPGFVDVNGSQAVSIPTSIVNGESSSKSFMYDQPASVQTDFELYEDSAATPKPKWFSAHFASANNPAQVRPQPAITTATQTLASSEVDGLFPFSTAYEVYAGNCAGNDPVNYLNGFYSLTNAASGKVTAPAGSTNMTVDAFMRRATITVKKTNTGNGGRLTSFPYFEVVPVGSSMTGCTEQIPRIRLTSSTVTFSNFTSSPTSTQYSVVFNVDLPWGVYAICADNGTVKRTIDAFNNTPPGGTPAPTGQAQTLNLGVSTNVTGQSYGSGTC